MSYSLSTLVACPTLQTDLVKAAKIPDPMKIVVPSPLTEYLRSPANIGTLQQEVSGGDGKIKTIRVKYGQRTTGGEVSYNQANPTCTASGFETNAYTDYTIDPSQNIQITRKFSLNDMLYNCDTTEGYLGMVIMKMINAVDQAAYAQHATQAYALAGAYGSDANGVTANELVVKTRKDSSIDPYPYTFQEIEIAAMHSGYQNPATIFGGTDLWSYAGVVDKGCCAASGVAIGELYQKYKRVVSYDRYVQEAMGGQSYNLMVMNGALQVITFNLFEGANGMNTRNVTPVDSQRVITSPNSGLPMDLLLKYDCGDVHIVLTYTGKVVGLPTDLFKAGDILNGVKFVNRIKVTNS